MGKKGNAYEILVTKSENKKGCRSEDLDDIKLAQRNEG
jgi:hypothetical protein